MSGRGNVQSDKCPVGEIAAGRNIWSRKCQVGEALVGELSSWGCVSWGSVGQGTERETENDRERERERVESQE